MGRRFCLSAGLAIAIGSVLAGGVVRQQFVPLPGTVMHLWEDKIPDATWTRCGEFPAAVGTIHSLVFAADETTGAYNHHSNLMWFGGKFHAVWSNHRYSEDGPGQRVLYAYSSDGLNWSRPRELIPAIVPETSWENSRNIYCGANEFVVWNGRFFGSAVVFETIRWENSDKSKNSPLRTEECRNAVTRTCGSIYREIMPDGSFGQIFVPSFSRLPGNTRFFTRIREQKDVAPGFSRSSLGYDLADAFRQNPYGRIFCEPEVWTLPDGRFAAMFRDDARSFCKWIAFSDDGRKWSVPQCTDIPDAMSLSRVCRLPDGRYLLVGNHRAGWRDDDLTHTRFSRDPLMISTSRDGLHFGNTFSVREGLQKFRVPWVRAREGGAQYPSVLVHGGYCHVMYSMGKEDIWVTRIPLKSLEEGSKHVDGRVARYVAEFNAADEELYATTIPNVMAAEFLSENIPILECPDVDIERAYYFRWWTFRKHLKKTRHGWVVTEFLPDVVWAGAENTIVCPLGHHVREGRWLRDGNILRDYMRFMVVNGTIDGPKSYVNWPALAYLEREKVCGERDEALALLPRLVSRYVSWEKGWLFRGRYPMRFVPEEELFHSADNREGMEYSASGHGARLMVNSAMAAEAAAIATLARAGGKTGLADEYAAKAVALTTSLKTKLWNDELTFFVTRRDDGVLADVREIQGYAPWYFLQTVGSKYAVAWQFLASPSHFLGEYGLTSADRSSPRYSISYTGHPCQWNGPSWPYTTSLTLTALGNAIRNGESGNLGASDYIRLLRQYAAAHRITKENGEKTDWIDENLNPDTGDWISRTMLHDRPIQLYENPRERGKDYNHSTFCDLVISDLAGFHPHLDGTFDVKPFIPPDWPYFRLDNIPWRGHLVSIIWDRDGMRYGEGSGLRVLMDGLPYAFMSNVKSFE